MESAAAVDLEGLRREMLRQSLDAAELQRLWQMRAVLGWLRDVNLARTFVKAALDRGELVLACDAARDALALFPSDLLLRQRQVIALAQIGSTRHAQKLLEEMIAAGEADSETLSLLGRTWKDEWLASRDPQALHRSLDAYRRAYLLPSEDPAYPGINVATLALLGGDQETAHRIAKDVRSFCVRKAATGPADYWNEATRAEALAVLGRTEEAAQAYRSAADLQGGNLRELSSTRRQARLIARRLLGRADGYDACFPELKLVVFSGHMIDEPDRSVPRFPPGREAEVKKAIREQLDRMDAQIGFASAARGADILFLEAMIERGATVHVVLPWARDQFIETSVRERGDGSDGWTARFTKALDNAASVDELGDLYMPSSGTGFDFCNRVMCGRARLMARWLDMELAPLALWDGAPGLPGGTGAFVDSWRRAGVPVRIVPVANRVDPPAPAALLLEPTSEPSPAWTGRQEIKAMLFADIVGYSRLPEECLPRFTGHFLKGVSQLVSQSADAPVYINTWGDAFFFVFEEVAQAGRFALALRDLVLRMDCAALGLLWVDAGVPRPLSIRIGLHAGPVRSSFDPVVRQMNFTGAHVSRAARIEPVTTPGRVFASEGFAALAEMELAAGFRCEFIGTVPLAKNHGMARLYDLRSARE